MKPISKSIQLASVVLHAALCIVRDAGGSMKASQVNEAVEKIAPKDDYAQKIIESNGMPRWRMFMQFFSIDAVKAGYLEKTKGVWRVTETGILALNKSPLDFLLDAQTAYKVWKATQLHTKLDVSENQTETIEEELEAAPPSEQIHNIIKNSHLNIAAELLSLIKVNTPNFFEKLVLELLLKMGYGKFHREAGRHSGQSGDAGIDGVINEDRLGLDSVYIQAKRWEGSVGRPDVQAFVGALQGQRAHKGVFITSSWFSPAALDYVKNIQNKVVLIDGERLAELMIEYNLGVSTAVTYELKKVDTDFFSEE